MNKTAIAQQAKTTSFLPSAQGMLQRKCVCGNHTMASGECAECTKKKMGLQRKLIIGTSDDPLEQEADRVAEQMMAMSAHTAVTGAPPRIQRFIGRTTTDAGTAPASVDHVLASSGSPLDSALRQDMEQRFGYDFSQVRIHIGAAAEQSARDVNAHAYTVGHNVVFGVGRFVPGTHEGRRLIAHELTHMVQQSGGTETQNINIGISNVQAVLIQREPMLSTAALELAAQHAPRMALMLEEYGALAEAGAIAAEEAAVISAAVAEAEVAVAAAAEVAAAGSTATIAGEASLMATAGLAADDVTGIGVADDVAIPFTLIFGLVAVGVGAGIAYAYRDEISTAMEIAVNAVRRLVHLIQETITRHRTPQTVPQTQTQTRADERQRRRENCFSNNPGAIPCDEPVFDGDDIRDEVVAEFLYSNGYGFDSLVNCSQFGSPIGHGEIEDCGKAPAIRYHCQVRGTPNIVSIFACLCCDINGDSHFQWSRPHWSINQSRRGN